MDRLTAILSAARYWAAQSRIVASHVPRPFVIVAGPRSGSTLLQKSLDQHDGVQCLHELAREVLKPPNFTRYFLGRRRALARLRVEDERAFLRKLFGGRQPQTVQTLGFKALYVQPSRKSGNWGPFWTALAEVPDLRVIRLRRNRLESVLSLQLAMKSQRFINSQYEKTLIEIEPDWVLMRMRKEADLEVEALELLRGAPMLNVDYLALTRDPQRVCNDVFAFLDVFPFPVQAANRKQRNRVLIDYICNWETICNTVERSEFANELQTLETEI